MFPSIPVTHLRHLLSIHSKFLAVLCNDVRQNGNEVLISLLIFFFLSAWYENLCLVTGAILRQFVIQFHVLTSFILFVLICTAKESAIYMLQSNFLPPVLMFLLYFLAYLFLFIIIALFLAFVNTFFHFF